MSCQASTPSSCSTSCDGQATSCGCQMTTPPKRLLYSEPERGNRLHEGQRKHFKDTLKASLKAFSIAPDHWEEAAQDRICWRYSVHKGALQCEAIRTAAAQKCRQDRKARAADLHTVPAIPCPHCQRTFRTQIGLASHRPQPQ